MIIIHAHTRAKLTQAYTHTQICTISSSRFSSHSEKNHTQVAEHFVSLTLGAYFDSHGCLDFYINSKLCWGIELTIELN